QGGTVAPWEDDLDAYRRMLLTADAAPAPRRTEPAAPAPRPRKGPRTLPPLSVPSGQPAAR
ncbi:MAG TPA: hypothetical protein PKD53_32405, partial [Chloroflexaceae bacterium]|nr:hypothetical protein [Chloroflexaceae bacterium]